MIEAQTPSPEVDSPLGQDLLSGVKGIADFFGEPVRRTRYMIEKGDLPAFKLRGRWYSRKSKLREMVKRLEEAAAGTEATEVPP